MSFRLTSDMWVSAHVRLCHTLDCPAYVLNRGDKERGGVLLKINRFGDGCDLLERQTDLDGGTFWMSLTADGKADERSVDDQIKSRLSFDEELWVIEIEDQRANYEPDAPVKRF